MKKSLLLLLLVIFVPNITFAQGWSAPLTVTEVYVYGDQDTIEVVTDGGTQYVPTCSVNAWEITATNAEGKNRIYSALLSAQISGKRVRFWYVDTCGGNGHHATNTLRLLP